MNEDQTLEVEQTTVDTGQVEEQTSDTGSEPQTNTSEEESSERKMIQLPADKWREANHTIRDLKAQLNQKSPDTQGAAIGTEQPAPTSTQTAIDAIAAAVESRLAPSLSTLTKMEQDQAIQSVASRPYADRLVKEIALHYNDPSLRSLNTADRMDMAYKLAVGSNIDSLVTSAATKSRDEGYNAAYDKIAEKQSSAPTTGGAKREAGSGEFTPDQIRNMSPQEYAQNKDKIFGQYGL